jgi:uncharacterized protein DUF2752
MSARFASLPAAGSIPQQRATQHSRGSPWRLAAVAAALTASDVAIDPTRTHVPLCPLHALTGLSCPLCGSLRAVDELVRGHVATAFGDNALLVAALPIVAALWLAVVVGCFDSGAAPRRWSPAVKVGLVAVLVGFGVVRNLPFAAALRP